MSFKNVLVVDDSLAARKIIIQHLKCVGLQDATFVEAPNGEKGLQVVKHQPIDLLLTDINMPVMDGYQLLENLELEPLPKKPAVLLVSSAAQQVNKDQLEQQFRCKVIPKPINPMVLRSALADLEG